VDWYGGRISTLIVTSGLVRGTAQKVRLVAQSCPVHFTRSEELLTPRPLQKTLPVRNTPITMAPNRVVSPVPPSSGCKRGYAMCRSSQNGRRGRRCEAASTMAARAVSAIPYHCTTSIAEAESIQSMYRLNVWNLGLSINFSRNGLRRAIHRSAHHSRARCAPPQLRTGLPELDI
jgi:hypothetical protein